MFTEIKKVMSRLLAVILASVMLVSMIPASAILAFAATAEKPDSYTVTVTDGTNPVEGATVTVSGTTEVLFNLEGTTDASGVAAFETTAIETAMTAAGVDSVTASIVVEKTGYEKKETAVQIATTLLADNCDVVLTVEVLTIPEADYTVSGYEGAYDAAAHGVSVVADGYTVKYSEDGLTYSDTVPTITNVGEKKVYVQISKDGYTTVTKEVTLKVSAAARTDFAFAIASPADLDYAANLTLENAATSAQEAQTVAYKSSNEMVATVDANGKVSFLKAGTVTITATMPASTNYTESTASYTVTVNIGPRTDFGFTTSAPSDITYGQNNNAFTNAAVNVQNDAVVTYSIVSQQRDSADVTDVAEINPTTGELKVLASGTVTVKAAVAADDWYQADEATYTLNIKKAAQTGFAFVEAAPADIAYNEEYKNEAKGGESTGAITYELVSGDTVVSLTADGTIKAIGVGEATVKAVKAADTKYDAATATYTIQVVKAEQTGFAFASATYAVDYGTQELEIAAAGGESAGTVTYSVVTGGEIASVDAATGKVTFVSQKVGTVTVKAVKAADEHYNAAEATAVITVAKEDMTSKYTL